MNNQFDWQPIDTAPEDSEKTILIRGPRLLKDEVRARWNATDQHFQIEHPAKTLGKIEAARWRIEWRLPPSAY